MKPKSYCCKFSSWNSWNCHRHSLLTDCKCTMPGLTLEYWCIFMVKFGYLYDEMLLDENNK